MVQSDTVLRWIVGLSAASALLALAWAQATRTTALEGAPLVVRENLLTGSVQICGLRDGQTVCVRQGLDLSARSRAL